MTAGKKMAKGFDVNYKVWAQLLKSSPPHIQMSQLLAAAASRL